MRGVSQDRSMKSMSPALPRNSKHGHSSRRRSSRSPNRSSRHSRSSRRSRREHRDRSRERRGTRRRDKEKCRDYEGWGLSFQFIQMFLLLFFFFAVVQEFSVEEFRSLVCLNFMLLICQWFIMGMSNQNFGTILQCFNLCDMFRKRNLYAWWSVSIWPWLRSCGGRWQKPATDVVSGWYCLNTSTNTACSTSNADLPKCSVSCAKTANNGASHWSTYIEHWSDDSPGTKTKTYTVACRTPWWPGSYFST